jgi:NPCBM/NEW2 domain
MTLSETRATSTDVPTIGTPVADGSSVARAQDVSPLTKQRRRSRESLRGRTRTRALTAIAVASTVAIVALPTGCSSPGPARGMPPTTAALTPPESPSVAATRIPLPPGTTTYLSDLRQVPSFNGNEFNQGVVGVIHGQDLFRSLRTRFCKNQGQVAMYNLRQPYSHFVATIGLDDRSDPSALVQFAISAGDDVVFQEQARTGQAVVVDVSIRDADILTLSATLLSANSPCSAIAIWGDARVQN